MKRPVLWIGLIAVLICQAVIFPGRAAAERPSAGTGDNGFIDIILVLDNSGSMKRNDPEFLTRDVVTGFIGGFGGKTRIGMVFFDRDARLAQPLTGLARLQDRAELLHNLKTIRYDGLFSDSPAAVERAIYELKVNGREYAEQVIILLTDGIVDTGDKTKDIERSRWLKVDLSRESEYAGIRIFGIAFTEKADFSLIQTLAIRTEGAYFRAFSDQDIRPIFDKIRDAIHRPLPRETNVTKPETITPKVSPDPFPVLGDEPKARDAGSDSKTSVLTEVVSSREKRTLKPAPIVPTAGSRWSDRLIAWTLIGILGLLGIVIFILMINRKAIPSKAAEAVVNISELPAGPVPGMPRAELVDVNGITDWRSREFDRRQMKIGRDPSNDIVIDRDTVSSLHAVIEYHDGFFYLEDQRSKNKTLLNGIEMNAYQPRKLKNGDELVFNKFKFKFKQADGIPVGETVMDFGGRKEPMARTVTLAPPLETPDTPSVGMPQALLIDVQNITGQKTVSLHKRVIQVGRGVHNDIVISRDSVSGSHATVEYRGSAFYLEDRRSKNGTHLNGDKISTHMPEKLKSGDEIMFDTFKFIFLLEHQTPAGDTNNSWG